MLRTDRRTDGRLTIAIPRFALRALRGKTEINLDGYTEDALLLGHVGELCYFKN